MIRHNEREEEWKWAGHFADGIIEANGNKRRFVVDGVVVREYEVAEK